MVAFDVPLESPVLVLVLYTGLSTGWHLGKAMTGWATARQNGKRLAAITREAAFGAAHHYDLGVALLTVGMALLVGVPPVRVVVGLFLVGFGGGMAYDDRQDHPPEGMLQHIRRQVVAGTARGTQPTSS